MEKYYDRQWKIGELAKIFNVNVQLLRHYDKEGLLVPDIRNPENKWRTYRYDQIYSLGLIRCLRYFDCSLDEIGEFMKGRTVDTTEEYLHNRMQLAKAKYEKLLRMESVIDDRFALVRSDMPYAEADQIFVYSEQEIQYIETRGLEEVFADELFYMYPTLVFYRGDENTFAVRIPHEDAGIYKDRVKTIPASDYLVGFHHGSYENIKDTFDRIRDSAPDVLDDGYVIGDEIITMNIVDQLIDGDRDGFVTRVMMKIYH